MAQTKSVIHFFFFFFYYILTKYPKHEHSVAFGHRVATRPTNRVLACMLFLPFRRSLGIEFRHRGWPAPVVWWRWRKKTKQHGGSHELSSYWTEQHQKVRWGGNKGEQDLIINGINGCLWKETFIADLWPGVLLWATMSESAAGKFSELWRGVSKLCDGKTFNRATEQQMAATETSSIKGDGGMGGLKKLQVCTRQRGNPPAGVQNRLSVY